MSYVTEQKTELKQSQVAEALNRMPKLDLLENVINEFHQTGKIYKSENLRMFMGDTRVPILYWLNEDEEKMVRNWEEKTGNVVYHVIMNNMEFGVCYSFLYVSKNAEEWEMDVRNLKDGFPFVYVENKNDNSLSEYGTIGIKPAFGGVLRTA